MSDEQKTANCGFLDITRISDNYPMLFTNAKYSFNIVHWPQGSHRLEKYLNLEGFHEKSLKIKSALKSTGKSL